MSSNIYQKYACYAFVHTHLSPIQKAVQSTHVVAELVSNYKTRTPVKKWVEFDKTLILLDGGNTATLKDSYKYAHQEWLKKKDFPCVAFFEDAETLGGIMTSFAFVYPQPPNQPNSFFDVRARLISSASFLKV